MDDEVRQRLLELNRRFYREFGEAYAEKRSLPHPGMVALVRRVPRQARVLDLGCGHGRVLALLAHRGFQGTYLGLDASPVLLEQAWARALEAPFPAQVVEADLASPTWHQDLPEADVVLCLAVLHHLPGRALRVRVLRQVRERLAPEGWLGLSVWNLTRSPRLKARIQPWSRLGLTWADVEPGDLLVDWRHRGQGLRYIHQFTLAQVEDELREAGFALQEAFLADGEDQRLGLYVLARPRTEEGSRYPRGDRP